EVIRGPMSTLYGSDAMGGVVNIITRKVAETWGGSVSADATVQQHEAFGDMGSATFYANGPLAADSLGLALWGGYFTRRPTGITYVEDDGDVVFPWMGGNPVAYDNFNLGARMSLRAGDYHDLWLEASTNRQKYDNRAGQVGTLGSGGYAEEQRYGRDQATLAWTGRFETVTVDASWMDSRTETTGRLIPAGVPGAGTPRVLETRNRVFDVKAVTGFGDHTLSAGGQFWDAEMVDGIAPAPFAFTQWALFAEDEWRFHEDLNLTLGLRRDEHSTFGAQL